jgi:hypothetical protein
MNTITLTADAVFDRIRLHLGKLYTVIDGEEVEIVANGFKITARDGVSMNVVMGGQHKITVDPDGKTHVKPDKPEDKT